MEGMLIFYPDVIRHCCVPVNGKFGDIRICNYDGGPLPIVEIKRSRDRYRAMFANMENYKDEHCYHCPNRFENDWTRDYLIDNVHFNTSFLCNIRCSYCIQRVFPIEDQKPRYPLYPVAVELLKGNLLSPSTLFFWSGGETVLLKDFDKTFLLLTKVTSFRHDLATNGTVFSQAVYDMLKQNDNLDVRISIDCGSPEKYIEMKGKDFYEKAWTNLLEYASTGGKVHAKYVITYENYEKKELDSFLERIQNSTIKYVDIEIDHNFEEYEKHHIKALRYLNEELKKFDVEITCGIHSIASVQDFWEEFYDQSPLYVRAIRKMKNKTPAKLKDIIKKIPVTNSIYNKLLR